MMRIHVVVTPELITRATQRDSRHCMIAEAIVTARPDFRNVMVDLATIRWTNPRTGRRYVALTPEVAGDRLVKFDQGEPVEPFEFNVEAIQSTPTAKRVKTSTGEPDKYEDGRAKYSDAGRRGKSLSVKSGRPKIEGGRPLPMGHLAAGANAHRPNSSAKSEQSAESPADDASNVVRSGRRFRQYGRRLLKG